MSEQNVLSKAYCEIFAEVTIFSKNQTQKSAAMGCSLDVTSEESEPSAEYLSSTRNKFFTKMNEMGCQPLNEPCNPFVLLQLSTSNRATQCYCNENGCNDPTNQFKRVVGGYCVIAIGIMGIVGNISALGVLCKLKKKNDVDIILTGTYVTTRLNSKIKDKC